MGFWPSLLLSFLALCITPSGESNIFPVAKLWYANTHCTMHDPISLRADSPLSFLDKILFPELSRKDRSNSSRRVDQIKSTTIYILGRSFIIKCLFFHS